ncbi:N-acyl amino acid synthase, PEP-CTERM/exosortase system-associated [Malonomonas rubra DSM 5091]|uniref:N-acyl amino acid synthase, PEP-CTERM/exosortase system-associated n=1 Tax=Malonomonas rubra DSM 5091 TaxID=1122189 RepID=A0A1M6KFP6_MALRU|nr:PEP-CTERM/exosortase system-associated acyltransferase [Malonomonas rubra]SHJ57813.1 N-acyl amino acid synthase, PEP-CTERM/exosortase system-associated [Malonomonas rubra DSM 5091]
MTKCKFEKIEKNHPLFTDVLALRYRIYCEQRGFENPEDYPDGLERDVSDEHAVHFAAIHNETNEVLGTIRLILKSPDGFPIENHFKFDKDTSYIKKDNIGEVSRLAVNSEACRELWRKVTSKRDGMTQAKGNPEADMIAGLIRCIVIECRDRGITHLYAVMARALFVILKRRKIVFPRIGPEIDYHGMRAPYFGLLENIIMGNDDLYRAFSAGRAVAAA